MLDRWQVAVFNDGIAVDLLSWERRAVIPSQDATWTWLVESKREGVYSLVMEFRPVVKVAADGKLEEFPGPGQTSITSTLIVERTFSQATSDGARGVGAFFTSLLGIVTAVVTVVAGVSGWTFWRRKKKKKK